METIKTMTLLRPTLTTLAVLATAVLAPTPAQAQQPQGAPQSGAPAATTTAAPAPANATAERAIKQMTAKLRNVLAAQEGHYSDHGTYTTSMTALGRYDASLAPSRTGTRRDSVSVQVIFAGGRGWTGIASHWGLRGRSCVVFVGIAEELPKLPITRADRRTPMEEGVPACDAAPAPPAGATPQPAAPATAAPAPAPVPAQPPARQ
jgi:pyruvate dehydrogenase E2 component (dihydrolipoamide acetyltransferase)